MSGHGTGNDHYFSQHPASVADERTLEVRLAGREVTVTTAAGVFSGERIDLGTRVLLREVPAPPAQGNLLDLGCGWGPVALTMGLYSPQARVWAVDVNPRAVELTARNAARLGLHRVQACLPDDVPAGISFAQIWSNPPIRVGKDALHALLLTWLPRMEPAGSAFLVVQRNLGADSLHRWLGEHLPSGWQVTRFASAKGYRVLRVASGPSAR